MKGGFTVNEENDRFGFGVIFGRGDVALEPADSFNATGWLAFVHGATEAAGAHSNLLRHFGGLIYNR